MTFDVAVGIYLFQPSLTYHPSPRTSLTRPLTHEAGLLQYHTQPAKTHRDNKKEKKKGAESAF